MFRNELKIIDKDISQCITAFEGSENFADSEKRIKMQSRLEGVLEKVSS